MGTYANFSVDGISQYLQGRRSLKSYHPPGIQSTALEGIMNPDFLALGLGGTNMMGMLWAVAMGKQAVGVEVRGDPSLGVHWNIREEFFHQLGLIDQMMLERYDEALIPRRGDGRIFKLADCFYSATTRSGDIVCDEIIDSFDNERHIVGTIQHVEYIDDRYKNGVPRRTITILPPPRPPARPDLSKIRTNMQEVLDGPSTFQAAAFAIQILLRRYLEKIEEMDLASNRYPRVRLFTQHRVIEEQEIGFVRQRDGRLQVRLEEVVEMDFKSKIVRVHSPGSKIIDVGVPELFSIAHGAYSSDAQRLGFFQHDVEVDHMDGRGAVVAQADYIAGLIQLLVDGRLRRRISSHFDGDGNEYWLRQIAVGHENDPEVAWVVVQVPDYMSFDPIEAGLVPKDTCTKSAEYHAAYQMLLQDFYLEQAALVLGMEVRELRKVERVYGPKMFSLVERMGMDARIAPNGVVAGDTFGNGHFLTSGGAMTGMVGHSSRFLEHWKRRAEGLDADTSIRMLADQIKGDTEDWLRVSAREFTEAIPINFGAERGAQIAAASGIDVKAHATNVEAARRHRQNLVVLDPSDWRRLFLKLGHTVSAPLPPLSARHPEQEELTDSEIDMLSKSQSSDHLQAAGAVASADILTAFEKRMESLEAELASLLVRFNDQRERCVCMPSKGSNMLGGDKCNASVMSPNSRGCPRAPRQSQLLLDEVNQAKSLIQPPAPIVAHMASADRSQENKLESSGEAPIVAHMAGADRPQENKPESSGEAPMFSRLELVRLRDEIQRQIQMLSINENDQKASSSNTTSDQDSNTEVANVNDRRDTAQPQPPPYSRGASIPSIHGGKPGYFPNGTVAEEMMSKPYNRTLSFSQPRVLTPQKASSPAPRLRNETKQRHLIHMTAKEGAYSFNMDWQQPSHDMRLTQPRRIEVY
jgi:hypothetical protein